MSTRVLLDTHVVLWSLVSPNKLSRRARSLIEDPKNARVVSAASAWEIATKFRLGKLAEAEDIVRNYAEHLKTLLAEELSVTSGHALTAGLWDTPHRDPFDRLLAAQSLIEGIAIVTNDAAMGTFAVQRIW